MDEIKKTGVNSKRPNLGTDPDPGVFGDRFRTISTQIRSPDKNRLNRTLVTYVCCITKQRCVNGVWGIITICLKKNYLLATVNGELMGL